VHRSQDSITVKGPKGTLKFAMPRTSKSVQGAEVSKPTTAAADKMAVPRVRC
jgi:hypothetical protein